MSNLIQRLLFEAKKLFNPLPEEILSLPDEEFELIVRWYYATPNECTEFLRKYYTKLSDHQFRSLVPCCNPVELAKFLLGHYAELSEEIFYLTAGRCSFVNVIDSDNVARFVQSANQCSSNSGLPPGVDLRVGHIKNRYLREEEKLPDTVFSQILHCAGSVGVLEFLKEYYNSLSVERFVMVIECIPESERFKFLEDHYSELSYNKLSRMGDIIDFSGFLRVHHVELSNEQFWWIVTKLTEGSSTFSLFPDGFLEKYDGEELSDEGFCLMVKELREFLPAFFPDFLENCYGKLSAERFNWMVAKLRPLSFEKKSYPLSRLLLFHFFMKYYSEPLVRGSLNDVVGVLGNHYRKKFFNTQILHFIPKDVCLTLLNDTYNNNEDHLFRSVILKIKDVDRAWFTYSEHMKCYSKLSYKRFILMVRWDPRQLDELPWEIATKERGRLIGILQESLDRIEAKKAQIETTRSGIDYFTLIQRVLACLQSLVK
jgi:hypothetical protein